MSGPLRLLPLAGRLAICRLPPDSEVPDWTGDAAFSSLTRTAEELSIVCDERCVPERIECERGWCGLRVEGTLAFELVGVLAGLCTPLAAAGVSLFALSTFDTDYLLVRAADWDRAIAALRSAGHRIAD